MWQFVQICSLEIRQKQLYFLQQLIRIGKVVRGARLASRADPKQTFDWKLSLL
jgi:hypothetical protein